MAPEQSPNYLDYRKTKQVKLPHLRKVRLSQKGTREHSECSLTVIGGTLSLPNRDVCFGSLADITKQNAMSALPPKADILSARLNARLSLEIGWSGDSTPFAQRLNEDRPGVGWMMPSRCNMIGWN
jgi:hypothetical protein